MQTDKQTIENLIQKKLDDAKKKFGEEFLFALLDILGLEKLLNPEKTRLIPLSRWNDYHPDPSVSALRMYVFRKDENGFDKVIVRRGKRILINEDAYYEWSEKQNRG